MAASEQVVERNELSTKQIQAELENKEFFLERQETDTDIIRQFETLLSAIKTWSNHVVGGKDLDATLKESQGGYFLHVAPSYLPIAFGELEKAIAKDRKKRRHFVRGLAAFKMSLLFRTPDEDSKQPTSQLDPWLDEHLAKSFSELENRLQSAGTLLTISLSSSVTTNSRRFRKHSHFQTESPRLASLDGRTPVQNKWPRQPKQSNTRTPKKHGQRRHERRCTLDQPPLRRRSNTRQPKRPTLHDLPRRGKLLTAPPPPARVLERQVPQTGPRRLGRWGGGFRKSEGGSVLHGWCS